MSAAQSLQAAVGQCGVKEAWPEILSMQYRGSLSHSTVICLFELIFFYISCYAFRRDGSAILFIPTMIFVIHQCKQATVSFPVTIIAASARSWPNALTKLSACHWYWTGNDAMIEGLEWKSSFLRSSMIFPKSGTWHSKLLVWESIFFVLLTTELQKKAVWAMAIALLYSC